MNCNMSPRNRKGCIFILSFFLLSIYLCRSNCMLEAYCCIVYICILIFILLILSAKEERPKNADKVRFRHKFIKKKRND